MKFIDLIASNNLSEAKESILSRLSELVSKKLEEAKRYVAEDLLEEIELDEANSNIIKMGRITKFVEESDETLKVELLFKKMCVSLVLKDIEFQVIL